MRRKQGNESWSSSMISGYKSGFRTVRRLDREDAKTDGSLLIAKIVAVSFSNAVVVVVAWGYGCWRERRRERRRELERART